MNTLDYSSTLRVGVLGCGVISANHMKAWSHCLGAQVVAVCDPRRDRAEACAREFGVAAFHDSPQTMFEAEALDLVDIITPRETHADMIRLAARHKVHALCEKPLCPAYAEAEELLREIRDSIRVMVNENWRYRPYYRQIGEWLRGARLGTIVKARIALWRSQMLRLEDGSVLPLLLELKPYYARQQRMLIADALIHQLDVVRSLFGEVDVVASCIGRASNDIIGEDSATIMLRTGYGMTVVVDGVLSAAGHAARAPDRVEIAGTRCSVLLDNGVLRLFGAEEEVYRYDEDAVRQGCFDSSIQHFVDQARSGGPFWTSAADQLGTLRLVERAYEMAGEVLPLSPQTLPPTPAPKITGLSG